MLCAALFAFTVSACGDGSSPASGPKPESSTTAPTTTQPPPSPTTVPAATAESLLRAVVDYQEQHDVQRFRYEVRNFLLSAVDQNWARFNVVPSYGNDVLIQGGYIGSYGVAHFDGTSWIVVDYGTSGVGCAPIVPPDVVASLQLGCPSP